MSAIWRHVDRGTEYVEIGRAIYIDPGESVEGCTLAILMAEDGQLAAIKATHPSVPSEMPGEPGVGLTLAVFAIAELQAKVPVRFRSTLVIYRGPDRRVWARERAEFLERFDHVRECEDPLAETAQRPSQESADSAHPRIETKLLMIEDAVGRLATRADLDRVMRALLFGVITATIAALVLIPLLTIWSLHHLGAATAAGGGGG